MERFYFNGSLLDSEQSLSPASMSYCSHELQYQQIDSLLQLITCLLVITQYTIDILVLFATIYNIQYYNYVQLYLKANSSLPFYKQIEILLLALHYFSKSTYIWISIICKSSVGL